MNPRLMTAHPWMAAIIMLLCGAMFAGTGRAQEDNGLSREAHLVRVRLPIDAQVAEQVEAVLRRLAKDAPVSLRPEERPRVILKFDTDRGQTGAGSQLSRSLDLARLLTSADLIGLNTAAYLPTPRGGFATEQDPDGPRLQGHAVLVALACNQLAAEPGIKIGRAGTDPLRPDPIESGIYRSIAETRSNIPIPIVLAMVDSTQALYMVTTDSGDELAGAQRLQELEDAGRVIQKRTFSDAGSLALLPFEDIERASLRCKLVRDRNELASWLKVDLSKMTTEVAAERALTAIQFDLPENIDPRTVEWMIRAIDQRIGRQSANLLLLNFRNAQGDIDACLKLARYLSKLDPDQMQTAAYVQDNVAGPAAVAVLACDQILMNQNAVLGGSFQPAIPDDEMNSIDRDLVLLSENTERDHSWFRSMVDMRWQPSLFRNRQSGQTRLLTDEELTEMPEAENWERRQGITVADGFKAMFLDETGVVRAILNSPEEMQAFYQLEGAPEQLTPTKTDQMLGRFASFLAKPFVSMWLLMLAMMLISAELNSPGLSFPGLLGTLCLALFFWAHYLDGNAEWFEIILFVIGIVFVLIEIFIVPGIGIFGIVGLLMMVVSIVLATQTFVVPRNAEDFRRLPVSLGLVFASIVAFLGTIFVFQRYGRTMPLLRKMMLEPPVRQPDFESSKATGGASITGKTGKTLTRLIPSGKAKIGGKIYDVLTEGEVVEPNTKVTVIEAIENRIIVKATSEL